MKKPITFWQILTVSRCSEIFVGPHLCQDILQQVCSIMFNVAAQKSDSEIITSLWLAASTDTRGYLCSKFLSLARTGAACLLQDLLSSLSPNSSSDLCHPWSMPPPCSRSFQIIPQDDVIYGVLEIPFYSSYIIILLLVPRIIFFHLFVLSSRSFTKNNFQDIYLLDICCCCSRLKW